MKTTWVVLVIISLFFVIMGILNINKLLEIRRQIYDLIP